MREIKFRVWREEKKIMHWDVNFVEMGGGKDEIVLFDRNKELYIDPLGQSPAFHRRAMLFNGQLANPLGL